MKADVLTTGQFGGALPCNGWLFQYEPVSGAPLGRAKDASALARICVAAELSERTRRMICRLGSDTPGFVAWIAGSSHEAICAMKILLAASRDRISSPTEGRLYTSPMAAAKSGIIL